MGLTFSNKVLDKYYKVLVDLDASTKKEIIRKLSESLKESNDTSDNLQILYGAWDDTKETEEISKEIKESRVPYRNISGFDEVPS